TGSNKSLGTAISHTLTIGYADDKPLFVFERHGGLRAQLRGSATGNKRHAAKRWLLHESKGIPASRFKNISPRRVRQRHIALFRRAHRGWRTFSAGMFVEPIAPAWPPGPFRTDGGRLPAIRIDVGVFLLVGGGLKMPARMTRWAHDAGVVAAVRQHESNVCIGQHLDFINGAPRRDMIGDRAHRENGRMNVPQRNRFPASLVTALHQFVAEKKAPEI